MPLESTDNLIGARMNEDSDPPGRPPKIVLDEHSEVVPPFNPASLVTSSLGMEDIGSLRSLLQSLDQRRLQHAPSNERTSLGDFPNYQTALRERAIHWFNQVPNSIPGKDLINKPEILPPGYQHDVPTDS